MTSGYVVTICFVSFFGDSTLGVSLTGEMFLTGCCTVNVFFGITVSVLPVFFSLDDFTGLYDLELLIILLDRPKGYSLIALDERIGPTVWRT